MVPNNLFPAIAALYNPLPLSNLILIEHSNMEMPLLG